MLIPEGGVVCGPYRAWLLVPVPAHDPVSSPPPAMLDAYRHEQVLSWLHEHSAQAPFDVKATAAPQYRRIALQQAPHSGRRELAGAGFRFADGLNRPATGINDGRGFMFISRRGDYLAEDPSCPYQPARSAGR